MFDDMFDDMFDLDSENKENINQLVSQDDVWDTQREPDIWQNIPDTVWKN